MIELGTHFVAGLTIRQAGFCSVLEVLNKVISQELWVNVNRAGLGTYVVNATFAVDTIEDYLSVPGNVYDIIKKI